MTELINNLSRLQHLVERLDDSVMSNWPDEAGRAFRQAEVRKIQELIDAHRLHTINFEQSMHDLQQTAR